MRRVLVLVASALFLGGAQAPDTIGGEVDAFIKPLNVAPASAAAFTARCETLLARIGELKGKIETDRRPATAETVLLPFDALFNLIGTAAFEAELVQETNPSPELRAAGEACSEKVSALEVSMNMSRPIYDRLVAVDARSLSPERAFVLERVKSDYQRAGVDRDEATRTRISALRDELTGLSLAFNRNIREDRSAVKFTPAELKGLPQDWLDAHRPGADGLITVTTAYPDYFPVMDYAESSETRRKLLIAFENRAWPGNEAVLKSILAKRFELARLLGRPNYAALVTEDKMIGTPQKAWGFIDGIAAAARPGAERDRDELLRRLQKFDPKATSVPRWDVGYLSRLVRKEQYAVDSAEVRAHFTYERTREGLFAVMGELFGVEFRPWNTAVWHPSVKAYEVVENGQVIGRFYLDMHPRDGKFSHAAAFPVRTGMKGRALPVSALICNFPAEGPMDHEDVETFFHEFGHLLHWIFAGRQEMALQNFGQIEWDFVEAPSQMLEEWVWDYDTLKRFAVSPKGEPISADLVRRMNAGRRFGEGGAWSGQVTYSAVSLAYHEREPERFDPDALFQEMYRKYGLYAFVPGTHTYAAFGHLDGYSAYYYTYPWSRAISMDLHTRFKTKGLRDRETAMRYRRMVLEPGGSKPAAVLIEDFLGRPFSLKPVEDRLAGR